MINWYKILIISATSFIFSAMIYVPEEFEVIQEAINFAEDLDSIYVDSGNYSECLVIEEKSILIIGNSQDLPTITCDVQNGIVVQMMNLTQQSVNLSNFLLKGNGNTHAINFNETNLELHNIECENFDEAAIYGTNSNLIAENIIIKNPGENAKFYIQLTNSDAVLNFGELSNLVSTDLNSKIFYSISSTVQMNNFYIQNNQTFDDGTFRIFNSRFIANNLTFENNQIEFGQGGAIYTYQSELDISNSIFKNNAAPIGGAISAQSSKVNLFNSNFYNNSSNSGGAISHSSDSLFINNCEFESNQSENGGALHLFSSYIKFHKSLCKENFSNLSGGCLSIINGELKLTFSNILNNVSLLRENIKSNNSQVYILNSIFEKVDYLYDNFQFYDETQAFISNSIFEFSDLQNVENDNIVVAQNNFNSEALSVPLFLNEDYNFPNPESIIIDNGQYNFSFDNIQIHLDLNSFWGSAPDIGIIEYIPEGYIGDLNFDYFVDILDVILLKEIIQNNSIFFEINIDISQDGLLNILDLILLIQLILDNG